MVVLTNFSPPTVGIRHQEANTTAQVATKDLGKGTLFIAESHVFWVGNDGQGFSLEYPAISLHAISRDPNTFPQECLYLMIDSKLDEENHNNGNSEVSRTEAEDEIKVSEIRFIPDNKSILDSMFRVMADCQALHPDAPDSASDDGYDDEDDEDEAEYDVSAAERQYGPADQSDIDEPMDLCQFEDAEH